MNAVQLKKQRGSTAANSADKARDRDDASDTLIDVSTASVALPAVGLAHPTGSIPAIRTEDSSESSEAGTTRK
jgi:hypothetical protein